MPVHHLEYNLLQDSTGYCMELYVMSWTLCLPSVLALLVIASNSQHFVLIIRYSFHNRLLSVYDKASICP